MDKIDPQIKVIPIDEVTQQKERARDFIDQAPQPAMTTPVATAISTGSVGAFVEAVNSPTLENMRTRINELENALVRLGLIKSR